MEKTDTDYKQKKIMQKSKEAFVRRTFSVEYNIFTV